VGNHDGGHFYPTLFGMKGRMYYSFDYGNVHVTVIDSYWSGGANRPRQLQWLEEDLAASTATWKIVSLHVPIVSTRSEPECEWFGRTDYLPLLEKYAVDVVLSGHQPMYKRYRPVGPPGAKPIIHITSGGGGPVGDPVPSPLLVKGAGVCHHSFFKIHGNTLAMTAVLPDGTVIDRLTLVKKDGRYQPEIMDAAVPADLAYRVRNVYQELLTDRTHVLEAEFDAPPKPGSPVKINLDTRRLPRGPLDTSAWPADAKLVLRQQPGNPWTIRAQEQDLGQPVLTFTVTAPADLAVGAGVVRPAMEAVIQLKVGDRLFEPYTATVQPAVPSAADLAAP